MSKADLPPATATMRRGLAVLVVLTALCLSLIPARHATGQSYDVCPSGCPFQTIQAAINAAASGAVVRIGPGTYVENIELRAGISLLGAGSQATVLQGLGNNSAVRASGGAIQPDTRLQALTITGGNANHGGGISVTAGAAPQLINVIVRDNAASGLGGGVYVTDSSAIILAGVQILRNRSDDGAALTVRNNAQATVRDSQIRDNVSLGPTGAVYALNTSDIVMENTVVERNSAAVGAGMRLRFGSTAQITGGRFADHAAGSRGGAVSAAEASALVLNGVTFANNRAPYAGAIHVNGSQVTISDCTLQSNHSDEAGGAMQVVSAGSVAVTGSHFVDNDSGRNGGAIYFENSSGSIVNSSFENNRAPAAGGAIEVLSSNPVTIAGSTFRANNAFDGGALYVTTNAQVEVRRSSFVANTARLSGGAIAVILGSNLTLTHSTLEGNVTDGYGGALTIQSQSTGLIHANLFRANRSTGTAPYSGVGIAGAIKVFENAAPLLSENRIEGNLAMDGAGVYVEAAAAPVLIANEIVGNLASRHGGGVVVSTGSTPRLSYNLIGANRAAIGGGGIFITSDAAPTLDNNTISGNWSGETGGGLAVAGDNQSQLVDNQITYNSTNLHGAGLHLVESNARLAGNEIRYNQAGQLGGGVMVQGNSHVEITANLIADNRCNENGDGLYLQDSTAAIVGNTLARNAGDGLYLALGSQASLINNLVAYNDYGIRSDGGQVTHSSHNAVTQNRLADYAGVSPGPSDIPGDPALIGGPLGDFYLQHSAAGQAQTSPLVDAGEGTAASWGLNQATTRTDSQPDQGVVDVGYHFPVSETGFFMPLILAD